MRITLFDILILMVLVGGAALGFWRGLFRQLLATLEIYISTVIATVGYRGLSRLISGGTPTSGSDVVAFVALMGSRSTLHRALRLASRGRQ